MGGRHVCRPGFEARAGKAYAAQFDDPWFDGSSYEATIVATPGRGTAIAARGRDRGRLERRPGGMDRARRIGAGVFSRRVADLELFDVGRAAVAAASAPEEFARGRNSSRPSAAAPAGTWRFASIELSDEVDLLAGTVAEQIGRLLWRVLDPDSRSTVPTDFVERHLIRKAKWVGIWSRQGIVIATKAGAAQSGPASSRVMPGTFGRGDGDRRLEPSAAAKPTNCWWKGTSWCGG